MKALKLSAIALALVASSASFAATTPVTLDEAKEVFYGTQENLLNVANSGNNALVSFAQQAPKAGAITVSADLIGQKLKNSAIKTQNYGVEVGADYAINENFKVGAVVYGEKLKFTVDSGLLERAVATQNNPYRDEVANEGRGNSWGIGARGSFRTGNFFTGAELNFKKAEDLRMLNVTGLAGYDIAMGDIVVTPAFVGSFTSMNIDDEDGNNSTWGQFLGRVDAAYKLTEGTKLVGGLDVGAVIYKGVADSDEFSTKVGIRYGVRAGVEQELAKDLALKFNVGYQQATVSKMKGFNANLGVSYAF